jgi:hypothetical protein
MNDIGHNWRSMYDDEYDRLVDLSAIAMIAASRKPELSKQSALFAKQAIARRGGAIESGRYLVRDIALAYSATSLREPPKSILANCGASFLMR